MSAFTFLGYFYYFFSCPWKYCSFLIDVHQHYSIFTITILILEVVPLEERHTVIIRFSFIDHSESRTLQQCFNSVWLGTSLVWLKCQVLLNPRSPVETCWKSSSRHVAGYFSLMLFSNEAHVDFLRLLCCRNELCCER